MEEEGSALDRARRYVESRQAPLEIVQYVQDHNLIARAHREPGAQMQPHHYVVLGCSCEMQGCFKVLKMDSVRSAVEARRTDPLGCPAHSQSSDECRTFSRHVSDFAERLEMRGYGGNVIWDWHDLAISPNMHIDATLLAAPGDNEHITAFRFEIDGPRHFDEKVVVRDYQDRRKDAFLKHERVSMLRLHHADVETWSEFIDRYVHWGHAEPYVLYTQAYKDYLYEGEADGYLP